MNITRMIRILSTGVVGIGAATSSYTHMYHVASHAGESPLTSVILPLTVDGMMIVATGAMLDDERSGRAPRRIARWAFRTGVAVSVAANVAGAHPTTIGRCVAAWPALALLLVVMILERRGKVTGVVPTEVAPDPVITPRRGRPTGETMAMADRIWATNPTLTRRDVATRLGISDGRLAEIMRKTSTNA